MENSTRKKLLAYNLQKLIAQWLIDNNKDKKSAFKQAVYYELYKLDSTVKQASISRSIEKYCAGESDIDPRNLKAICAVLKISPEKLYELPDSFRERLIYDDDLSRQLNYSDESIWSLFRISPYFMRVLNENKAYKTSYQISNLVMNDPDASEPGGYGIMATRTGLTDGIDSIPDGNSFAKLTVYDFLGIVEMQSKVHRYIDFLIWEHNEALYQMVQKANKLSMEKGRPLTYEELCSVDGRWTAWPSDILDTMKSGDGLGSIPVKGEDGRIIGIDHVHFDKDGKIIQHN